MPLSTLSGANDPRAGPNPARMYDYFLGGSHNTALDRQVAEQVLAIYPDIRQAAWANRAFLRRVVDWMLADGIVQFIDIGAGLPTLGSVHELIQAANPAARVVYIDTDPVAIFHSQTILHGNPNATALHADARQINAILDHEAVTRLLALQRTIGVLLLAVLHCIADDAEVAHIVQTLRQRLAPGSCIAIAHVTDESAAHGAISSACGEPVAPRTRAVITRLFAGWDLVAPGVVSMPLWHPESPDDPLYDQPECSLLLAGVGRKPGQSSPTRGETQVQRPTPQAQRLAAAVATPAGGSIPDHLRARRDAIAQQWYAAVRGSGYPLRSLPEVAASLGALTDQIITVLAATSLDDAQAEAIGAELAKLHAVQPAALGQTITVLGRELLAGLSPDQIATFAPQLAALLGALAAGFARQAQQTIRAEQETIAHMLFGALTQVDAELQSRDAQLHMVIHHAPLSLFTLDRAGVVQMAAGQGVTNLGLNAADIVGQSAFAIVRDLPAGQIRQIIDQALAGERFCRTLATGGRAFEVWYVPQYDQANTIQGVIGVALDITERHQAEAELLMVRRRLAEQAEEERRRLANALHDQAIQQLVQIGYQLDVVQRFVARGATPAEHNRTDLRPGLERIRQDVLAVAAELRDMSRTLRPAGLDELGLSIVLADWITRFQATAPPDLPAIHVNLDQCSVKLPELAALCLLRVAQEALRNVARHAQARQVTVTLRFEADAAVLQVADDGRGFTVPANLSDLARRSHYGLVSLAEQTTWAGGQFSIESQPGAGTVVTARAPLER